MPRSCRVDAREAGELDSARFASLALCLPGKLKPSIERGSSVNKNELIAAVASEADLSKADATRAVDAVFESITAALKAGDEVRLVGFGTFVVSERAASTGRNPRTGEAIDIAASKQPKFKAGKGLKDAVQ